MWITRYSGFLCALQVTAVVAVPTKGPTDTSSTSQRHSSGRHPKPKGNVSAVYDLIDRVLPGMEDGRKQRSFFRLLVVNQTEHDNLWFRLEDDKAITFTTINSVNDDLKNQGRTNNSRILITGTSVSELTAGFGWYLRHVCNMTVGWPRGGGSHLVLPADQPWPVPMNGNNITRQRIVPWSYFMNVCTHSYSLVWYDWTDWERFIDWMALRGINLMLGMTGQEEVQYKVFRNLGLKDLDIRSWFNGPALLTWSRGQNEYGSNICGPLPRSWMTAQWSLQRDQILPRLRSLGIVAQLPAFQGNVPVQLQHLYNDTNMTQQGTTGWMDSLDPLYGKIADMWMDQLIQDFGTDHWYQLDGYFNGGTAPWLLQQEPKSSQLATKAQKRRRISGSPMSVEYASAPKQQHHDDAWYQRGVAAYTGLNRTDPQAVWSYQGFAFVGWTTSEQASYVKGFIDSAPKDKFIVIDMSYAGGEWTKWDNASFFGAPFVWTALHNFGATDGMKGDLYRVSQQIPFDALKQQQSSIFGTGATPEGIDQNPAFYDVLLDQNFRTAPIADLPAYMIKQSHKRYGLSEQNKDVTMAWDLLTKSVYSTDLSVQDQTGVAHLKPSLFLFEADNATPQPILCKIYWAWRHLIAAASSIRSKREPSCTACFTEPFSYDLVNVGREVLAHLASLAAVRFSNATAEAPMDHFALISSGNFYIDLLKDIDKLVATDSAFLLGPWLESAKRWGGNDQSDCFSWILNNTDKNCEHFYEWNARVQLTTWNPTAPNDTAIPGGPIDYAAKHWSGLIRDYYSARASIVLEQALFDEKAGAPLNQTRVSELFAQHAFNWTTARDLYPLEPEEDPLDVSLYMHAKYHSWFVSCPAR